MIIPLINADTPRESLSVEQLVQRVRYWSLLGKVAVTNVGHWRQADLEELARRTGGAVELQIDRRGRPDASLVELLNQGTSLIFDWGDNSDEIERPASVPSDSWLVTQPESVSLDQGNQTRGQQTYLTKPTPEQMARLDHLGVDTLVDVGVLENQPNLIADFLKQTLTSDRSDGLWPTVIVDEVGLALGLAYSNHESLLDAIWHRRGTYWSRSRGGLWVKGLTSGNTQRLIGLRVDCDRDCLRFQVAQDGAGFCHLHTYSCFGYERSIATVIERLRQRCQSSDEGSMTKRLVNEPELLQAKLLEEARELAEAQTTDDVAFEAADVMYFSLVKMLAKGVEMSEVHRELARRMTRVIRRQNKLESK